MATSPVRVLHVFGRLGLGGAETRTIDLYRNIDRDRVQFDFLVHTEAKEHYDDTVRAMGARIFHVPRFRGHNFFAYRKALQTFFASHRGEWRIVQGHMTSTASVYLPIAKKNGVKKTIAHARSAGTEPGVKTVATRLFEYPLRFPRVTDERFAVSRDAGESVFGKRAFRNGRVKVVTNAIDTGRVAFDFSLRERLRAELGLRGATVIGHAGSFVFAKNHAYLLRVFAALRKMRKDEKRCVLMLAGDGVLRGEIRAQAEKLGIEKDVLMLGSRNDMNACYSAMDLFLYPSHYEGLPGVVIEAQAAGLSCIISANITTETDVTPLVTRMPIDVEPEEWARAALDRIAVPYDREERSAEALRILRTSGFDVREQARRMCAWYLGETDTL